MSKAFFVIVVLLVGCDQPEDHPRLPDCPELQTTVGFPIIITHNDAVRFTLLAVGADSDQLWQIGHKQGELPANHSAIFPDLLLTGNAMVVLINNSIILPGIYDGVCEITSTQPPRLGTGLHMLRTRGGILIFNDTDLPLTVRVRQIASDFSDHLLALPNNGYIGPRGSLAADFSTYAGDWFIASGVHANTGEVIAFSFAQELL